MRVSIICCESETGTIAVQRHIGIDNDKSQGNSRYDTECGKNTREKIFLLSYAEANKYFGFENSQENETKKNLNSRVAPTDYAVRQGVWSNPNYTTLERKATAAWWLRSPGSSASAACIVSNYGTSGNNYVIVDDNAVRPTFWLSLISECI